MMGMPLELIAANGAVPEMEGVDFIILRVTNFLFDFSCVLVVSEEGDGSCLMNLEFLSW